MFPLYPCIYVCWFPLSLCRSRFLCGLIFLLPEGLFKNVSYIWSLLIVNSFSFHTVSQHFYFTFNFERCFHRAHSYKDWLDVGLGLWRCWPNIVRLAFFLIKSLQSFFPFFLPLPSLPFPCLPSPSLPPSLPFLLSSLLFFLSFFSVLNMSSLSILKTFSYSLILIFLMIFLGVVLLYSGFTGNLLCMGLLFSSDLETFWSYFFKYFSNIPTSGISVAYIFGTLMFHGSYWLCFFS